jgi:4-hydroxythreonine-4-phosphate dehydrogenase
LSEGREAIVSIGTDPEVDPKNGPMLSAALAQMVRPLAEKVGALVATGGETARAVLNAWGVTRLRLIREVETGLPYAITEGWRRQLPVLTKAGSFGSPQTLLACQRFLCELDRNPAAAIDPAATMNRGKAVRS